MRLWVFKHHFSTIFQLYIDLWAILPGANMVQGRNTLGYLRTRTFYIPERKYAYKYASITKWHVHLEKCKKKSLNIHSHVWPRCPTKKSDLDLKFVKTFVEHFGRNMSDLRVWSLIHFECTVGQFLNSSHQHKYNVMLVGFCCWRYTNI